MLPHPVTQLLRRVRGKVVAQAPQLEFFKTKAEKRSQIDAPNCQNDTKQTLKSIKTEKGPGLRKTVPN